MKTLAIINEPISQMVIGKNTTLAYILVAAEFSDVYVQDFAENCCYKIDQNQAQILTKKYREINRRIRNFEGAIENIKVFEVVEFKKIEPIAISTNDLLIQRLEPMKSPFPPVGEKNIDEVLSDIRRQYPRHIFNCPIGLHDKDLAEFVDIATPTAEFGLDDQNLNEKVKKIGEIYSKIYANGRQKIVIKPRDFAQSMGVFSIDFADDADVRKSCIEHGEKFYRGAVLAQPFLEGVRRGDIRVSVIKNFAGDFEVAASVFRKSLRKSDDENFTTGFIVGGSTPRPISDLSEAEQLDLAKKTAKIVEVLNGKWREKYSGVIELGIDFILVGNDREVMLGEINHHCPGLMPVGEAIGSGDYDGGLFLARKLIKNCVKW
jgi:hypothetical protein